MPARKRFPEKLGPNARLKRHSNVLPRRNFRLLPLLPLASNTDPKKCRLAPVAREVVDSVDGVEST